MKQEIIDGIKNAKLLKSKQYENEVKKKGSIVVCMLYAGGPLENYIYQLGITTKSVLTTCDICKRQITIDADIKNPYKKVCNECGSTLIYDMKSKGKKFKFATKESNEPMQKAIKEREDRPSFIIGG